MDCSLRLGEMLLSGNFSTCDILKIMMQNGRTAEMEETDTKMYIENLLLLQNIPLDEKVNLVKKKLNEEAKFAMEELIRQSLEKTIIFKKIFKDF